MNNSVKDFHKNGFFHAKNIIDKDECILIKNFLLKSYIDQHLSSVKDDSRIKDLISKYDPFHVKDQDSLKELKSKLGPLELPTLHGTISTESRLDSRIIRFCESEGIVEIAKEILQDNCIFLHMAPATRIIHPNFKSAFVPPHNDFSYNQHLKNDFEKYPFITCWVPLHGKQQTNGGLKLYPNIESKEQGIKNPDSYWLDSWGVDLDESHSYLPDYKIGDAILFNPYLMHGSNEPNSNSNDFRISMDFRIFSSSTKSTKHYYSFIEQKVFEPGEGPCGTKSK